MKEKLNLALYELKYAFIGIKRHLLLCLSAISAITISLFLMAAFLVVGIHVDHFAMNVQSDLSIHVILDQDIVEDDQIDAIENQILELSNVDSVEFSDKENELELMIDEKGDAFSIYKGEENPLSNAFLSMYRMKNKFKIHLNKLSKLKVFQAVHMEEAVLRS